MGAISSVLATGVFGQECPFSHRISSLADAEGVVVSFTDDPKRTEQVDLGQDDQGVVWSARNLQKTTEGFGAGLAYTLSEAYAKHYYVELRPEDVLLHMSMITALWMGNKKNAETVRKMFVQHEGKRKLEVIDLNMESAFVAMNKLVNASVLDGGKDLVKALTPDFTTTTDTDRLIATAAIMATYKHYFAYGFGFLCGLPGVILHGTHEDWVRLRDEHFTGWYEVFAGVWPKEVFSHTREFVELLVKTSALRHDANGYKHVQGKWAKMITREKPVMNCVPEPDKIDGWILGLDPISPGGSWRSATEMRQPKNFTPMRATVELKLEAHPTLGTGDFELNVGFFGHLTHNDRLQLVTDARLKRARAKRDDIFGADD